VQIDDDEDRGRVRQPRDRKSLKTAQRVFFLTKRGTARRRRKTFFTRGRGQGRSTEWEGLFSISSNDRRPATSAFSVRRLHHRSPNFARHFAAGDSKQPWRPAAPTCCKLGMHAPVEPVAAPGPGGVDHAGQGLRHGAGPWRLRAEAFASRGRRERTTTVDVSRPEQPAPPKQRGDEMTGTLAKGHT